MVKTLTNPYTKIRELVAGSTLPNTICILCPDQTRRQRALDYLLNEKKLTISNRFDGRDLNFKILLQALSNRSLFDSNPVTLVSNCDQLTAEESKKIANLINENNFEGLLIITAKTLLSTNAIRKAFNSNKDIQLLEFEELEAADLHNWVAKELKNLGIQKFSNKEVDLIIKVGVGDADKIIQIITHLSIYVDNNELNTENILTLFNTSSESQDFAILDSIHKGITARESLINRFFNIEDKNPFLLLAILNKSYSNYFYASEGLKAGIKQAILREKISATSFAFEKHVSSSRFYSSSSLKKCLQSLVRADSKLKNKNLGTDSIFSELLDSLKNK